MITAISPVDGRYASKTAKLVDYFSEWALIKYRVRVEILYFIDLCNLPLPELKDFPKKQIDLLLDIYEHFSENDGQVVKAIERITNHDVKAVEYFLKEKFEERGLHKYIEFLHFGLTSQDINNTAIPLSLKEAFHDVYLPQLRKTLEQLENFSETWKDIPMLAKTHGQPASPTLLGKEFAVFHERLRIQLEQLEDIPFSAKFGGATGNMNAHFVAYPDVDWHDFADQFVDQTLGLDRSYPTTQIEHYDNLAAFFHALSRINTILIDLARDVWSYISMDYFKQKVVKGEVGSSAMPHKVNPIDFENAEGNLGIANALFQYLGNKLPVSRLQRDLTDSTVLRNIGVPLGHTIIAFQSLEKGINKLVLNQEQLNKDLENNWAVVAEAIQSILRREGIEKPYERLKDLTRGQEQITQSTLHDFIHQLEISDEVKEELKAITPFNYVGKV